MTASSPTGWKAEPLPRGRHKLPAEEVRASQRDRLLRAMEQLVGAQGYEATSVPQVTAAARVSSNAFYKLFPDKAACFIALCERQGDELLAALAAPGVPADPEGALAALDAGLETYLRWWTDRPAMARAYFLELPKAGTRALEERDRQYDRFAALVREISEQARAVYPDAPPLRDVAVRATSIVVTELVAREIRQGRLATIGALHADLRHLLLTLLVGDAAARWADAR